MQLSTPLHSIYDIHWHPWLSHLPAVEAHQVSKKVPKLNVDLLKKTNTKEVVNELNNRIEDPTGSANLDQLRESLLEDLLQPIHSSF